MFNAWCIHMSPYNKRCVQVASYLRSFPYSKSLGMPKHEVFLLPLYHYTFHVTKKYQALHACIISMFGFGAREPGSDALVTVCSLYYTAFITTWLIKPFQTHCWTFSFLNFEPVHNFIQAERQASQVSHIAHVTHTIDIFHMLTCKTGLFSLIFVHA